MSCLLIKLWLAVNQWLLAINISSLNPPQPKRSVPGLMTPHNLKAMHARNNPETYSGFHISHTHHLQQTDMRELNGEQTSNKHWQMTPMMSGQMQELVSDEVTTRQRHKGWTLFLLQVTRPVAAVHTAGVVHFPFWPHGGRNVFLVIRWWGWRLEWLNSDCEMWYEMSHADSNIAFF